ncbi:MAG: hypothetical protein ABN490_15530, partial [Pantoea agglomerans]
GTWTGLALVKPVVMARIAALFHDQSFCKFGFGMQAAESENVHKPKGRLIVADGQSGAKD